MDIPIRSEGGSSLAELYADGPRLTTQDLAGIIDGTLDGHRWTYVSDGSVYCEATVDKGDFETVNDFTRSLLCKRQDCQYGGQISVEEARLRYRDALMGVLRKIVHSTEG